MKVNSASEYWAARKARDARRKLMFGNRANVSPVANYCFCAATPLYADRCEKCGKRPFTD